MSKKKSGSTASLSFEIEDGEILQGEARRLRVQRYQGGVVSHENARLLLRLSAIQPGKGVVVRASGGPDGQRALARKVRGVLKTHGRSGRLPAESKWGVWALADGVGVAVMRLTTAFDQPSAAAYDPPSA